MLERAARDPSMPCWTPVARRDGGLLSLSSTEGWGSELCGMPIPAPGLSLLVPGARGSSDGPGNPWPRAYVVAMLTGSAGVF